MAEISARRFWLRIGMQKTGTSAVQSWLAANENALGARGLLYLRPKKGLPASGTLVSALTTDPPSASSMIAALTHKLDVAGPRITDVLISSENFSIHPARTARPLLDAFGGCDIRILVWLRRQDMFAEALTKQWIKWNGRLAESIEGFMGRVVNPLLDYERVLDDWSTTFPQARVMPQVYPEYVPNTSAPDSIAALLDVMQLHHLIPSDSLNYRENVSPHADLVRHYQTLDEPKRLRIANRKLMLENPDTYAGRADLFTSAERARIRDDHAASNARLCQRWFPYRNMLFDAADPTQPGDSATGAEAVAAFRRIFDAK